MRSTPFVSSAAVALAVSNVIGFAVARRYGEEGRPFGVPSPVKGGAAVFVWGTALSAPIPMIVIAAVARRRSVLRVLGAAMVVGQLSEPIVWRRAQPVGVRVVAAANVVLGARLAAG